MKAYSMLATRVAKSPNHSNKEAQKLSPISDNTLTFWFKPNSARAGIPSVVPVSRAKTGKLREMRNMTESTKINNPLLRRRRRVNNRRPPRPVEAKSAHSQGDDRFGEFSN